MTAASHGEAGVSCFDCAADEAPVQDSRLASTDEFLAGSAERPAGHSSAPTVRRGLRIPARAIRPPLATPGWIPVDQRRQQDLEVDLGYGAPTTAISSPSQIGELARSMKRRSSSSRARWAVWPSSVVAACTRSSMLSHHSSATPSY